MKKILLLLFTLSILIPEKVAAQKGMKDKKHKKEVKAEPVGNTNVMHMKEKAELTATQWIIANNTGLNTFSLKTHDFDRKTLKYMYKKPVITFEVHEFVPQKEIKLNGDKQLLFGFTSKGWINEKGINFDKITWCLINSNEWLDMMVAFAKVSSEEKNEKKLRKILEVGKLDNKGIKIKGKLIIPFYKLKSDMYMVPKASSKMKLFYNQKSLGIFFKETNNFAQIGTSEVSDIHSYFFD